MTPVETVSQDKMVSNWRTYCLPHTKEELTEMGHGGTISSNTSKHSALWDILCFYNNANMYRVLHLDFYIYI